MPTIVVTIPSVLASPKSAPKMSIDRKIRMTRFDTFATEYLPTRGERSHIDLIVRSE
jgi:hypothetical protein